MNKVNSSRRGRALFFLMLALLVSPAIRGQFFDNFAEVLNSEWKQANFDPALVSLSFPDSAIVQQALRLQASPVPGQAPAAAVLYRDDVYTDFFMSVDLVDWPGTDRNQALVLIARGAFSANPATTTGIILNYDASQHGESATDRRQGQLQINMVTNNPAFGTKTLAAADVTLIPGRTYRLVFKGEGSHYTGYAYDLTDLTAPVVTIQADDDIQGRRPGGGNVLFDAGFKNGKCGLIVFSREGTTGSCDFTVDNYYAGPSDPDPADGPGRTTPWAWTDIIGVASRVPAARFKNFHDSAQGLSFAVKTYTNILVNTAATKLRLNGTDVSSQLILPPNASNVVISLPGSVLSPNTVYNAQLETEVEFLSFFKSTNTFWFDTFSDSYLESAAVKVIEAEEYNYNGGSFQLDPIPGSGYDTNSNVVNGGGIGYFELAGIPEIDFHDSRVSAEATWAREFRSSDPVGVSAGIFPEIEDLLTVEALEPRRFGDYVRKKHAALGLREYAVHRTDPGEWLNYTRVFQGGNYHAYLRVASLGETRVELHRVTSDRALENQTTVKLGTFDIPNLMTRYNYRYIPLVDDQGAPQVFNLGGEQTLRLQMAGTAGQDAGKIAINYLLLVPAPPPTAVRLFSCSAVDGKYTEDASAIVNLGTRTITIAASDKARFFRVDAATQVRVANAVISRNSLTLKYE